MRAPCSSSLLKLGLVLEQRNFFGLKMLGYNLAVFLSRALPKIPRLEHFSSMQRHVVGAVHTHASVNRSQSFDLVLRREYPIRSVTRSTTAITWGTAELRNSGTTVTGFGEVTVDERYEESPSK